MAIISHLAQPPGHGSLYSFIRCPPGPGVVVLGGDLDVDGVGVLTGLRSGREQPQPGHRGLLLCWANCLTQGPAAILLCQRERKFSPIFLTFFFVPPRGWRTRRSHFYPRAGRQWSLGGLRSDDQQNLTSVLEEFQLEQLAVETFPVEPAVSFSLSFLLASSRAAATSMVWSGAVEPQISSHPSTEEWGVRRCTGETCSCYSSCLVTTDVKTIIIVSELSSTVIQVVPLPLNIF